MTITVYTICVTLLLSIYVIVMCFFVTFAISLGVGTGAMARLHERRKLESDILALRQKQRQTQ